MLDVKPVEPVPKVYKAPVPFRYKLGHVKVFIPVVVDVNLPNSTGAFVATIEPAESVTNAPFPPVPVAIVLNVSMNVNVAAELLNTTGPCMVLPPQ
jgi:hypothetical protein